MADLSGLLIGEALRNKDQEHQQELRVLQQAIKSGADPEQIQRVAGTLHTVTPSELNHFTALTEILRDQEKKQQKIAQAGAAIPTLANLMAGQLGPNGPQPASNENQTLAGSSIAENISGLNQAGRPDLIAPFMNQLGLAKQTQQQSNQEKYAQEQRSSSQQMARTRAEQSGSDYYRRRAEAVGAEATVLGNASAGTGLTGPVDDSLAGTTDRLIQGGWSPREANKMAMEAKQQSGASRVEAGRWLQGQQGKDAAVRDTDSRIRYLTSNYPELAQMDQQALQDTVNEERHGRVVLDPIAQKNGYAAWIPTSSPKDADRLTAKREDLSLLQDQQGLLEGTYRAAVEAGVAGPGTFEKAYDVAGFFGKQPPEVAAYRNIAKLHAASMLKAAQGARPSEFDLILYLSMMPGLSEIGKSSGDTKLEMLDAYMNLQINAPLNPKARKELADISSRANASAPGGRFAGWVDKANEELSKTGNISDETLTGFLKDMDGFTKTKEAAAIRDKVNSLTGAGQGSTTGPALPPDF